MQTRNYMATTIVQKRRYPTYQLYANTVSKRLPTRTVFHICILETMKWLRKRLSQYSQTIDEINLPEPENYAELDESKIHSFHLDIGCSIDCTYSESTGLWAFTLIETDQGENIGTKDERRPVNGRMFETNISFQITDNTVETGFQTICSEPVSTTEGCKIFRPSVVRALYSNENVGLSQNWVFTSEAFEIKTEKDVTRVKMLVENPERQIPVVIVTTPEVKKAVIDTAVNTDFTITKPVAGVPIFNMSSSGNEGGLKFSSESLGIKSKKQLKKPEQKKVEKPKPAVKVPEVENEPETLNCQRLASRLCTFAFVCHAEKSVFESIRKYFCSMLSKGDVLCIHKGGDNEIIKFDKIRKDTENAYREIVTDIPERLKRCEYKFGNVKFSSDARLVEIKSKNNEKLSLSEQNQNLRDEIDALRTSLKKSEEFNRDTTAVNEQCRIFQKQVKVTNAENESLKEDISELNAEIKKLETSYTRVKPTIDFYKEKVRAAALFPTQKGELCDWIRDNFEDTIYLHTNADYTLKKFDRPLNIQILCDAVYFLSGYAKFRRGEIDEDTLKLYAEGYNWDVQPSGDEAMKIHHSAYTVQMNLPKSSGTRQLDLHIKNGVNPSAWIRIYFFWDSELRKIVIGSMPDHLPTVRDKT